MPYTPPAASPLASLSPATPSFPASASVQNAHSATAAPMLPPPLHPQTNSSTVFYLNGPAPNPSSAPSAVPRSASFLHKQPRSPQHKPQYFTQQNRQMFTVSTVASANATLATESADLPPRYSKPSARHIETSGDADDEDDGSSTNTDDDDEDDNDTVVDARPSRRIKNLAALQEAILQMPPQRRQASPARNGNGSPDMMLGLSMNSSVITSSYDTDDEDHPDPPKMVRKKSGELVKPSLKSRRPSSVPSTPTYPKNVHFDAHLEHVRHFLQAERPAAVSNQASPADEKDDEFFGWKPSRFDDDLPERSTSPLSLYDWELVLPNFPAQLNVSAPVFLERVFLSSDQRTLLGHVAVKNLAFSKWVAAKFTVDYWKTVSEVAADYTDVVAGRTPRPPPGYDRFSFSIKLQDFSKLEYKTLLFCIRYNTNGQEFWDNNDGKNYQVEFKRKPKSGSVVPREYPVYDPYERRQVVEPALFSVPAHFLSSTDAPTPEFSSSDLPASRQEYTSPHFRPPRPDALDYSFDSIYTTATPPDSHLLTSLSDSSLSSKIKTSRPPTPVEKVSPSGRPFNSRYDFRLSLNAVIASSSSNSNSTSNSSSTDTVGGDFTKSKPSNGFAFGGTRYSVLNKSPQSHSGIASGEASPNASPMRRGGPSSEDMRHVNDQLASLRLDSSKSLARVVQEKPPIDSTSYQHFLDNYCFFQGPQRTKSPQTSAPASPTSGVVPSKATPRFYLGDHRSTSPSPDNASPFASPPTELGSPADSTLTPTPTVVN